MKNILNKIAQMERNAAEIKGTELSKHQVELAAPNPSQYDKLAYEVYSNANKFAEKTTQNIVVSYQDAVSKIKSIQDTHSKEFGILQGKAKELGLDINNSPIGKEFLKVGDMLMRYQKNALDQQQKYGSIKP